MTLVELQSAPSQYCLGPLRAVVNKRILRRSPESLFQLCSKSWVLEPASHSFTRRPIFLDNQLERLRLPPSASSNSTEPCEGGKRLDHLPTQGYLLKDVVLLDGVLYKDNACTHLTPRLARGLKLKVQYEIDHAVVYSTASGIRYFGQWLMDDCLTYQLAREVGLPLTSNQPISSHASDYENILGMNPLRHDGVRVQNMVLFHDIGQNASKRYRRNVQKAKLLGDRAVKSHPGVMLLRGTSGTKRRLINESEIANMLCERHGFKIINPMQLSVSELISYCAGAKTVVGVEGSQLVHGIGLLERDCNVLTLQPPNRFMWTLKDLTDRDGQNFGFVVGKSENDDFYICPDEVSRTLDLFPKTH